MPSLPDGGKAAGVPRTASPDKTDRPDADCARSGITGDSMTLELIRQQRETAERLREFWNLYMTLPIVTEQCMTWLDLYPEEVIQYGVKEAARKQALLRGQMTLDALIAYATRTMFHENSRRATRETRIA